MNSPRTSNRNQRRSGPRQRRAQNLLEVTVRSRMANQQRNRRILVWTCKLILVAAALFGTIFGGRRGLQKFFWQNPEYNLAVVEINNDGSALSRETILTTAGLRLGENIFSVSLAKARDAISALPQVDHVEMQKVLPNKIAIELTERRPVAWLADSQAEDPSASDKSFLIDAKFVLFKPKRQLPEYLRLPAIYGVPTENFLSGETVNRPEVNAALNLIQRNGDSARFHLQSIDLSKGYCMVATDSRRAQITFSLDNIDRQLERLGALLDYVDGNHQEIQTVNLMVERNIPVTFAPTPSQEADDSDAAPADENGKQTGPADSKGSSGKSADKSSKSPEKKRTSENSKKGGNSQSMAAGSRHTSGKSADKPSTLAHKKTTDGSETGDQTKTETKAKRPKNTLDAGLQIRRAEPAGTPSEPQIRRAQPVTSLSPDIPNQVTYKTSHG